MAKIGFLFPGQGSQSVGMGKDFFENRSESREMFEQAGHAIGINLADICINGPEEKLQLTEITQPAILTHSIIALKTLREHGIESDVNAGHSLGEYSALVASGSIRFLDAVRLVHMRGRFMQEAVPVGTGAMAAIIGLPVDKILEICQQQSSQKGVVQPANLNSPEQTVIAGNKECVERVIEEAKKAGAKKSVLLPVSSAFHCSLMKPAEVKLQKELEQTGFEDFSTPIITNVDAKLITQGAEARESLVSQVCSTVRWVETMELLEREGVDTVIEIGPGRVLSGLMRRFIKKINCYQAGDLESLNKTVAELT